MKKNKIRTQSSKNFAKTDKNKHAGKILIKDNDLSVVDCVSCGFKHIIPFPSTKKLEKLYKQEFYSRDKPDYFKNAKEDLSWWMATYNNYYSLFEKHTKGRKILDIGSGPGDFLLCGKKRGWEVLGIEPSVAAWKYSKKRKLSVINNFFNYEAVKQQGSFDVINAAMVLEHVPNPISFIEDMKKLLKPNGLIAIYSPNDFNPLQEILHKNLKFTPWWVIPQHHLNYFDINSIKIILTKFGFEVLESLGTFPMEFFLLSGTNYVKNNKIGRKCQEIRKTFEMNIYKHDPSILNTLYTSLIANNIGRSFFIIAKNKSS